MKSGTTSGQPRAVPFRFYVVDPDPVFDGFCKLALGNWGDSKSTEQVTVRKRAIRLLLLALAAQGKDGLDVAIPMEVDTKNWLKEIPSGTSAAMKQLIKGGWVEQVLKANPRGSYKDFENDPEGTAFASGGRGRAGTFRLTPEAWNLLNAFDISLIRPDPDPKYCLLVKEKTKDSKFTIEPPPHPSLEHWRKVITCYNEHLASFELNLADQALPPTALSVRRIFNSQDYCKGGRYYSSFHVLPKNDRETLHVNGESVISFDFAGLHPRLAFASQGLTFPYDKDIYTIEGYDRDAMKVVVNATLSAGTEAKPFNGAAGAGDDKKLRKPLQIALKAFKEQHPELGPVWGRGYGLMFQRADSEMMTVLIEGFTAQGKFIATVHDELVILEHDKALLKALLPKAMKACFDFLRSKFPKTVEFPLPFGNKSPLL